MNVDNKKSKSVFNINVSIEFYSFDKFVLGRTMSADFLGLPELQVILTEFNMISAKDAYFYKGRIVPREDD